LCIVKSYMIFSKFKCKVLVQELCVESQWVFLKSTNIQSGPDSSLGIGTGYGLDGLGIESRWGARFPTPVHTGPGAHPASCTIGTGSFPGVESSWGVTLTPHSLLVPRSNNRVELYLYSLRAFVACKKGETYLLISESPMSTGLICVKSVQSASGRPWYHGLFPCRKNRWGLVPNYWFPFGAKFKN
jgi:hypothetical protein